MRYLFTFALFLTLSPSYAGKLVLKNGTELYTEGSFEIKDKFVIYRDLKGKLLQLPLKIINLDLSDRDFVPPGEKTAEELLREAEIIQQEYIDKISRAAAKRKSDNDFQKIIDSNTRAFGSNSDKIVLDLDQSNEKDYGYKKYSKSQLTHYIYSATSSNNIGNLRKYHNIANEKGFTIYEANNRPFVFTALSNDHKGCFMINLEYTNIRSIKYNEHTLVTAILTYQHYKENFDALFYLRQLIEYDKDLAGRSFTSNRDNFLYTPDSNNEPRGHNIATYLLEQEEYSLLEEALKAGFNPTQPGLKNRPAIFFAIEKNDLQAIELLLKYGSAVAKEEISEYSIVEFAIKNGHLKHFKLLLDEARKANISCQATKSPLLFSVTVAKEDQLYSLQHILKDELTQSDFTNLIWSFLEMESKEGLHFLSAMGANFEVTNAFGDTPLLHAIKVNKPLMVKSLIEFGASPKAIAESGTPALEIAKELKHKKIIEILSPHYAP